MRTRILLGLAKKLLLADVTPPLPIAPGYPAREDYAYERRGTANLFLWYEPLQSRRHVEVTAHRCRDDWAYCIQRLVDEQAATRRQRCTTVTT